MNIEKMQEKHLKQVAEIERLCFVHPWSENSLKAELSKDGSYFFVATDGDKAIGYIGINTVLDEAYVTNVAVLQNYQGQGIGKALVDYACELCKEKAMAFLTLEVRRSNAVAISLYTSLKFRQVGVRKGYYTEPTEDALLMTRYFE